MVKNLSYSLIGFTIFDVVFERVFIVVILLFYPLFMNVTRTSHVSGKETQIRLTEVIYMLYFTYNLIDNEYHS